MYHGCVQNVQYTKDLVSDAINTFKFFLFLKANNQFVIKIVMLQLRLGQWYCKQILKQYELNAHNN